MLTTQAIKALYWREAWRQHINIILFLLTFIHSLFLLSIMCINFLVVLLCRFCWSIMSRIAISVSSFISAYSSMPLLEPWISVFCSIFFLFISLIASFCLSLDTNSLKTLLTTANWDFFQCCIVLIMTSYLCFLSLRCMRHNLIALSVFEL